MRAIFCIGLFLSKLLFPAEVYHGDNSAEFANYVLFNNIRAALNNLESIANDTLNFDCITAIEVFKLSADDKISNIEFSNRILARLSPYGFINRDGKIKSDYLFAWKRYKHITSRLHLNQITLEKGIYD